MANPTQNDIGTVFRVKVKEGSAVLDISTSSNRKIRLRKPSGELIEKTAALTTDGTDGLMEMASASGDLDEYGKYTIQGGLTLGSWSGHTGIAQQQVDRDLA